MLSSAIRDKLRNQAYRELHFKAVAVLQGLPKPNWYDAQFLTMFEAAKHFLSLVRPDCVDTFVEGFDVLRTPKDFTVKKKEALFDEATRKQIDDIVACLPSQDLERHEVEAFGRDIVHDHPFFSGLQADLTRLVSDLVGCELEPGYNFLSLYGSHGQCALHLDHPLSMYTLDYCIAENANWPIYVSKAIDWPELASIRGWTPETVMNDPANEFREFMIEPGNGIIFSGSGQWHYRNAMKRPGYCHLLFFHYFPKGSEALVYFSHWPELFDIPELTVLCDLFEEVYPHLARKESQ